MKKVILLLTMFLMTIGLSSCKGNGLKGTFDKVDYHICGIYFEVLDDNTYRIDGNNPCVYYSHASSTISYNNGSVNIEYINSSKDVVEENNAFNIIISTNVIFPSQAQNNIKIYIIKEKNGTLYVDKEMSDTINISKADIYDIDYKYNKNDQNYRFKFTIRYSKKGA